MKKMIFTIVSVVLVSFGLISWNNIYHLKSSNGADPGYTGSPFDGKTCVSCHSGPTPEYMSGLITSNVPAGGYIPNTEYQITVHIDRKGHNTFGFEAAPQDSAGNSMGLIGNASTETILTGINNYVTHSSLGTSGTDSKSWIFKWIAPIYGTGDVTFYAAIMAANGKGTGGDTTFVSTLTIPEDLGDGIKNMSETALYEIRFDHHAKKLIIETNQDMFGIPVSIFDMNGRKVFTSLLENSLNQFDISNITPGVYFVNFNKKGIKPAKIEIW